MRARVNSSKRVSNFVLLLFALSIPLWIIGAAYDVQVFPGLKLFQLSLATPAFAALILAFSENGRRGIVALMKRTLDFRRIRPKVWYIPIFLIYPSIGLLNTLIQGLAGVAIPAPRFSILILLAYSAVFFLTFFEEIGLTGYVISPLQQRHGALVSGLIVGVIWASYHVPGFIISGFYSPEWIFWHALYIITGRVLFVWVYNNSGQSLFSMALLHSTFGLYWTLWPQTGNLQQAPPVYDPRIAALTTISYAVIVAFLWGPKTLTRFKFKRLHELS